MKFMMSRAILLTYCISLDTYDDRMQIRIRTYLEATFKHIMFKEFWLRSEHFLLVSAEEYAIYRQ